MAKKPKKEKYDEGYVRGKRACLIGIFPIFIFLGIMLGGTWMIYDYYNKMMVNQDNNDICKFVRQAHPSIIRATWPCELTEKDGFWITTFNENNNTSNIPVFMSFKVNKKDKSISAAYDVK